MKRTNELTMGQAIQLFIKQHGMEERVFSSMALDAWEDQMGDYLKQYTDTIYVRNRILYVKLTSPALKNELSYGKEKIKTHINTYINKEFIKEIIFL